MPNCTYCVDLSPVNISFRFASALSDEVSCDVILFFYISEWIKFPEAGRVWLGSALVNHCCNA